MWIKLIQKDLLRFSRDRSALITLLAMPIIIMSILGFALQSMFSMSADDGIKAIDFAMVDLDQKNYQFSDFMADLSASPIGGSMLNQVSVPELAKTYERINPRRLLFDQFLDAKDVSAIAHYHLMTQSEADAAMKKGDIAGVVTIPKDFSKNMTLNLLTPFRSPVSLEVLPNGEHVMGSAILKALVGGFSDAVNQAVNAKNVSIEQSIAYDLKLAIGDLSRKADEGSGPSTDLAQTQIEGFKPIDSKGYYAIAMMSMFLMFTAAMGGSMVLEEKEAFTYDRHMMAGLKPFDILVGKSAVIAVVTVLQISALILFAKLVFGVDWGSLGNLLIISASVVFAISALGILLATIGSAANSHRIARVFENGFIQVLALFGGSYLPVEQLPAFIQAINAYVVNGIILKAYLYNMMGYSLSELMPQLYGIWINGVLFAALALVIFWRREAKQHVAYHQAQTVDPAQ